jgi:hypothetical protein
VVDDIFVCRVLPSFERKYRREMAFAPVEVAARFSFERDTSAYERTGTAPLGFHGAAAFCRLASEGRIPSAERCGCALAGAALDGQGWDGRAAAKEGT